MKRSRDYHRNSTIPSSSQETKNGQHSTNVHIKEEIVDQNDETRSNNQSTSSSQENQQVPVKKEEPADDYDTKPKSIKCELKGEEDRKSEFKSEFKSESLLLDHSIIKRECIKNELTEEDCGCNECSPFHSAELNDQNNLNNTVDTKQDQSDDDRCPTPDYIPSFFSSNSSDDDSEEDDDDHGDLSSNDERVNSSPQPSTSSSQPAFTEHDNEDSNQEATTRTRTDHYVRRSSRATAKPRSSYVSPNIESCDDSDFESSIEISNSDESDDTLENPVPSIPSNEKSRKQTESSGEETELEEDDENEEQEPNRPLKEKSPKRLITIVHLKCSVCGQTARDECALKLHQLTEHQIRRFRCPVGDCSASFEYCEQVQEHKVTEHGDLALWPCRECSFEAMDYKRLLHHNWQMHQAGHFKCAHDGCQFESLTTRSSMMNHFKDHLPTFRCSYHNCDKSYKHKVDLVLHVRLIHTGEKSFECKECSKSFATLKILNKHVRTTHEDYKPYRCTWPKCQYSCAYASNITKHVRFHLRVAGEPNRDPNEFVERKFRQPKKENKKDYDKAVVVHDEPKDEKGKARFITLRLDCPVEQCPVNAPNKTELNQHLLQSHQIDQHRCLLPNCTASFKYLKQLTAHRRSDHKDMARYECPKCHNYSSINYKKLIAHNYLQHEMGHFQCAHDGCEFVSTTNRQKVDGHRYTHVESKFKCTFDGCAYAAKDKRLLETHLKRHRETKVVKRYDCTKCCRFFPRLSDLVRHEKSHLKDGYRCQWKGCDYFAGDTERIKLHLCEDHKLKKPDSNQWCKKLWKYCKRVIV